MASAFDDTIPWSGTDAGASTVSMPHPDTAPSAFDAGLPTTPSANNAPSSSITGSSWQTIVGKPQIYGQITPPGTENISPDTTSGILHGIREGILDKPAEWLSGAWDWATGGNQSAQVRQANKDAADAARINATDDPGGYQAGNTFGRAGSQMVVANPALRAVGGLVKAVPVIGRAAAPWITGTAGEATPGIIGTGLRTAAGGTSGALAGAGTAALSGDDPIRGIVEGGAFGGGLSLGAQGLQRALQTLRGTYVPPEVRTPGGNWQASDQTAQRATQAQTLTDAGVPVMTRQVSQDPALRVTDAPWSGQGGDITNQQQAFRRASLSNVTGQGNGGTPGAPSMATDQFVADQGNRISGNFQGVANRNNIDFGSNLAPKLTALGTELNGIDPATREAIKPYIQTVLNGVSKDAAGNPIISGQKYLDLTRSDSPLQTLAGSDGLPAQYGQRIINMLHDGLAASASPADQALLATSRQQYRALQAVKDARGSDGSFEPKDLFNATEAQSKRYGGSSGTLDSLAKAGTTVLQPSYGGAPYKGTAAAIGASAVPAGVGTLAAHAVPGLLSTVGAAAVPAAVTAIGLPPALQALNRNPNTLARAIQILQGGAEYAPYTLPRQVVAPGVVATQQQQKQQPYAYPSQTPP